MLSWLLGKKKEETASCTIDEVKDCDYTNEQDKKSHTYKDSKEYTYKRKMRGRQKDEESHFDTTSEYTDSDEEICTKKRTPSGSAQRVIHNKNILLHFIHRAITDMASLRNMIQKRVSGIRNIKIQKVAESRKNTSKVLVNMMRATVILLVKVQTVIEKFG